MSEERGPELDIAEAYLRRLIELTETGRFDELGPLYRAGRKGRDGVTDLLKRNQCGHLRMLKQALAKRSAWVWSGSIRKVWIFGVDGGHEYPSDDGLVIEVGEGRAVTDPFGDNVIATRRVEKLKPEVRDGATAAGIGPFAYKEILRLRGRCLVPARKNAIDAFTAIDWGARAEFDSAAGDEDRLISGLTFSDRFPHLPDGFARRRDLTPIGADCYHYFGLIDHAMDPADPMVVSLDHETEGDDPMEETFLSLWLAGLRRVRASSAKRGS
jgi:hypothetical protein